MGYSDSNLVQIISTRILLPQNCRMWDFFDTILHPEPHKKWLEKIILQQSVKIALFAKIKKNSLSRKAEKSSESALIEVLELN